MDRLKKGFTLVELLVVISIIAILLAVLMPSLSKARMQARLVICGTNQKTVLTAVNLYMSSNNGKLPPSTQGRESTTVGGTPWWTIPMRLKYYAGTGFSYKGLNSGSVVDVLGSYMKNAEYFACPLAPYRADWQQKYLDQDTAFLNCSYFLLWNFLGYKTEGFSPVSGSKDTLMMCDFLIWGESVNSIAQGGSVWISPHPRKGSYSAVWKDTSDVRDNDFRIWMFKDPYGKHEIRNQKPDTKMNAGYLDGHVQRASSKTDYTIIKSDEGVEGGTFYLPPQGAAN